MIKTTITILILLLTVACSSDEKNETTAKTPSETLEKAVVTQEKESKDKNSTSQIKASTKKATPPTPALEKSILTITTIDGKEIHVDEAEGGLTFQELKDKGVIVIFFGYRCPPCLHEIPSLIALINKKHPDLEIIAIEVQGLNLEALEEFKKKKGINYTLATQYGDNSKFIQYIGAKAQWGGSIPFLIAFDKKGEVKVVHVGGLRAKQLDLIYESISEKK